MRKIFLSLLFSFSFFFLINSVSAEERLYVDFTNAYEFNNTLKSSYIDDNSNKRISFDISNEFLNRIINKANSKGKYYVILLSNSGTDYDFFSYVGVLEYSDIPVFSYSSSGSSLRFNGSKSVKSYQFNFSSNYNNPDDTLIYINDIVTEYENDERNYFTSSNYFGIHSDILTDANNNHHRYVPYYSNFDIKISNSSSRDIKIGNTIYTNGDTIPTLQQYLTPTTNYTLKNAYSSADYNFNHIEFYVEPYTLAFGSVSDESIVNFKLQAEANDPNNPLVPNLVSAKVYGLPSDSLDNNYELVTDPILIPLLFYEIDTTLGQYIITGSFTVIPNSFSYSKFKIDFEFENTNNGTIYVYDDFVKLFGATANEPFWECKRSFLYGYTRYSFPTNSVMALVSSQNSTNGRLYTSYNATINEDILFKSYYYDYANDEIVGNSIVPISLIEDPYYVYYDFSLDYANDKILMLHQVTDEQNYFYLPNDFNVTFVYYHDTSYPIDTPEGTIEHDYVAHESISTEDNGFIYSITSSFNYFIQPITYITSLISDFYNGLPIGIKYLFVSLFGLVVAMFIVKFLL